MGAANSTTSVSREENIKIARDFYDKLKGGFDTAISNLIYIEEHLKRAGADAAALDPKGKKTAAQMEDELISTYKTACLKEARQEFQLFKEGKQVTSITQKLLTLHDNLKRADVDAAALDPEGKKTAAEMEKELESAAKTCYIKSARSIYSLIKNGSLPSTLIFDLRENLRGAGVDAAALDPEGKKTAAEMEAELKVLTLANDYKDKGASNETPKAEINPLSLASVKSSLGKDGNTPS